MSEDSSGPRRGAVVVGASAGVGRALAAELAAQGWDLVVAAREARDLAAVADDLELRWPVDVVARPFEMSGSDQEIARFCEECATRLETIDAVFVTVGQVDAVDRGLGDLATIERLVRVNYTNVLKLIARFGTLLEAQGGGTIALFSSIAAAAPRSRNVVYASAKAGLEAYCRGLRHYFAGTGVTIQVYALGYVDTAMSFGQKLIFPVVSPRRVARFVVANAARDLGRIYYPRFWYLVTRALRCLPWFVYKRLQF